MFTNIQPLGREDLHRLLRRRFLGGAQPDRAHAEGAGHHVYRGDQRPQAWEELQKIATYAESTGRQVKDLVQLVLTDVEMPEMDGYILTKNIKSDPRFAGIPVIMHSSLSSMSNQQLGKSVGVDEYVPKFEPQRLAETLTRLLLGKPGASGCRLRAEEARS